MFSKEESAKLRQEFWTSFGKSFPKKWILYNTKIKGFSFKFVVDTKKAMVVLDVENNDELTNEILFDKLISLKSILKNEFLPDVIYDENYELENGKIIKRIYCVHQQKFSIHNKETWFHCYQFLKNKMEKFEEFFYEYEDVFKNAI